MHLKNELLKLSNLVTIFRTILAFMAIYFIKSEQKVLAAISFALIFPLDSLDGFLARKLHLTSSFGARFDLTSDYISGIILIYAYKIFIPEIFSKYFAYTVSAIVLWIVFFLLTMNSNSKSATLPHPLLGKLAGLSLYLSTIYFFLRGFLLPLYQITIILILFSLL
ncbi:CDP-alcohol phosphatidyltransferase family protein, partial [Candidatus Peregrinibacteria bacterium]|nr:CDP-alcohol phosphatidyltransferase family protein [Candidatus Peregrinibacteria bacterium]